MRIFRTYYKVYPVFSEEPCIGMLGVPGDCQYKEYQSWEDAVDFMRTILLDTATKNLPVPDGDSYARTREEWRFLYYQFIDTATECMFAFCELSQKQFRSYDLYAFRGNYPYKPFVLENEFMKLILHDHCIEMVWSRYSDEAIRLYPIELDTEDEDYKYA